jgi:peptidoglycan/xylan/chitin deacetylase (PgdA/CDA1 family)
VGVLLLGACTAQTLHLVANRRYGSSSPVCRVDTQDEVVALSFDDGPGGTLTAQALSVLGSNGASATFFVQGNHVAGYESLLQRESDAGMEIANHTWSHPDLTELSDDAAVQEIRRAGEVLDQELGADRVSGLFRAPFGFITAGEAEAVRDMGYVPIHWSVPVDPAASGLGTDPSQAADALVAQIQPGDILLAHDGSYLDDQERRLALATISLLLPKLDARGIEVTDVGHLLKLGTPVLARPRTWFWQSGFECPDP